MKRVWKTIRWLMELIALGCATTVTITWAIAAWTPHTGWSSQLHTAWGATPTSMIYMVQYWTFGAERRDWVAQKYSLVHAEPFNNSINDSPRVARVRSSTNPLRTLEWGRAPIVLRDAAARTHDGCEHATGWPWPAAWYEILDTPAAGASMFTVDGGIRLKDLSVAASSSPAARVRALPMRPIWLGVLGDVAAYALTWGAMIGTCIVLRGWWRRRNGLCPRCAYDLHGLAAGASCPECGGAQGKRVSP